MKSNLTHKKVCSNLYLLTSSVILLLLLGNGVALQAQQLDSLQRYALANNPRLQAQYKSFEAAMESIAQAESLPDPSLSIGYFISPVETRVGPQRAKLSLSQMFPWFGTLNAQGTAATQMAEAAYQSFLDAQNRLNFQVAQAYYNLYEIHRTLALEEQNIALLTSYKNIANARYENAEGTMVDVLRVDLLVKEATSNVAILKKQLKPAETALNVLLNRPDSVGVEMVDSLTVSFSTDNLMRDSLIQSNPSIKALDHKMKASKASEEAAAKQGFPKIGLGLDYVVVGERSDMVVDDNGKDVLMPMVTVSLPIFRGKYKAAKRQAQLMQESYALQITDQANQLTGAYEQANFDRQKRFELITLYQEQLRESQQALNLLFSAYSNSGESFVEVLRMQQQLIKLKKLLVSAKVQFSIAEAQLDFITAQPQTK